MKKHTKLFFDCMETIIDMTELPKREDYALWAIEGDTIGGYWQDADAYLHDYFNARNMLEQTHDNHLEYELKEIYKMIVSQNSHISEHLKEGVILKLEETFIKNYLKRCYIAPEKLAVLKNLASEYSITVVSNYKVKGAIEHFLKNLGPFDLFDHIIVSADYGYKKPHHAVYNEALKQNKCLPDDVVFIGDDFLNDYETPNHLSFRSIFYDPRQQKKGMDILRIDRFEDLYEVLSQINVT